MAKRRADRQLNKDEADIDDDPEEIGEFKKADNSVIANRVMITAKRRTINSSTSVNPLTNFAGFSTAPKGEPFSFFGKATTSSTVEENKSEDKDSNTSKSSNLESLKALNLSCVRWIQQHLDKNPYVVLLPVFKDYEKHLSTLNLGMTNNSALKTESTSFFNASSDVKTVPAASISSAPSVYSFGMKSSPSTIKTDIELSLTTNKTTSSSTVSSTVPSFTFGTSATSSVSSSNTFVPKLSFGLNNGSTTSSTTSFFGPPKDTKAPSIFAGFQSSTPATTTTGVAAETNDEEGEPSDEPPSSEFVPVGEDGSSYDVRCKIFFKKDDSFTPVGVGTLFLKPTPNGKTQLIARADTTQGSVILNLLLTPDLPLQRTGKNNVLLVCVPTPDANPPPVPVLIRVKSAEERDKLISEMEKLRST